MGLFGKACRFFSFFFSFLQNLSVSRNNSIQVHHQLPPLFLTPWGSELNIPCTSCSPFALFPQEKSLKFENLVWTFSSSERSVFSKGTCTRIPFERRRRSWRAFATSSEHYGWTSPRDRFECDAVSTSQGVQRCSSDPRFFCRTVKGVGANIEKNISY